MKILKWGLLVVAVVAAGGYVWWTNFGPLARITPKVAFSLEAAPDAPDYAQDTAWVALPDREDEADLVPPGVEPGDRQADAVADVFFIHPTTYILPNWNAPVDTKSRSQEFIELIVASNGSVFNGCCRVFAPQYRQATIAAFIVDEADGLKALDLAYQDVRRAFRQFIESRNEGRPFIVAAHSQGSYHAYRLIADELANTSLGERLIAVYALGAPVTEKHARENFGDVGVCDSPEATGCLVTYDTWEEGTGPDVERGLKLWKGDELATTRDASKRVCVNPVSWRADGELAPADVHLGAVPPFDLPEDHFVSGPEHTGRRVTALPAPKPKLTSARCGEHALFVPKLPDPPYRYFFVDGFYHVYDYTLFYLDIRANALARTRAWSAAHPPAAPEVQDAGVAVEAQP